MKQINVIKLHHWSVFEVTTNIDSKTKTTVHLVGIEYSYSGRVSPPIIAYNKESNVFVCSLTNVYELIGEPGTASNSEFVFKRWLEQIPEHTLKEITHEFD